MRGVSRGFFWGGKVKYGISDGIKKKEMIRCMFGVGFFLFLRMRHFRLGRCATEKEAKKKEKKKKSEREAHGLARARGRFSSWLSSR